ncbi:MAG: phosphatidylserine decarboxylase [Alphaproteobacteria bacterium]|jgi:phosphatidylserine decarboxylase
MGDGTADQQKPSFFWQIADDGWPVLALAGLLTILLTILFVPLGTFALGMLVWLAHILRVPGRRAPASAAVVLAPADGRVTEIAMVEQTHAFDPEATAALRITIRTSLSDAQLQMAPIDGRITDNFSIPGLFGGYEDMAVARADNERREITLTHDDGFSVMLVQLGGKTARQLVCRHHVGRFVTRGTPLGMARLAGVVDLLVPADCSPQIAVGQHVLAGETIVARLPSRRRDRSSD